MSKKLKRCDNPADQAGAAAGRKFRRGVLSPFVLMAALAAVSAAVSGQTYRTFQYDLDQVRERARLRIGFIQIQPAFRLSEAGYDSNVYYRDRGEATVSDYSARLGADVKAFWIVGNSLILSFAYTPEYLFYMKEAQLRRLTHSYSPGFRLMILKRLVLSGDFHNRQSVRRAFSEFAMPLEDTQKGTSGSLFFETPRGTAFGLSAGIDDFRYRNYSLTEDQAGTPMTLDRRERTGALEFYYRVFSDSVLFFRMNYTEYEFSSPESSWRDARAVKTIGGVRFPVLGRARGTLSLGYKKFSPVDETRKPFSGLVASTDLSFRVGRIGLKIGYLRDNFFSYLDTAYYYVEDLFKGGLSFYLFPFLRFDASLQTGALNYPESHLVWYQGQFYAVEGRQDLNRVVSLGLAVRISGGTGIGVNYNFYRRTSDAPGYNIDRDFLGAFITYDF